MKVTSAFPLNILLSVSKGFAALLLTVSGLNLHAADLIVDSKDAFAAEALGMASNFCPKWKDVETFIASTNPAGFKMEINSRKSGFRQTALTYRFESATRVLTVQKIFNEDLTLADQERFCSLTSKNLPLPGERGR